MSHVPQEEQLLAMLRAGLGESGRGFTATSDVPAGVLILKKGHCRGVWHWRDGAFAFTPAGYGAATYKTATSQDAVLYTLHHVRKQ